VGRAAGGAAGLTSEPSRSRMHQRPPQGSLRGRWRVGSHASLSHVPPSPDPSPAVPRQATTAGGVRLFAGHTGWVRGELRLAGGFASKGGSPSGPGHDSGGSGDVSGVMPAFDGSRPVRRRASAGSPTAGWDFGTHARLTETCRIAQAPPCSPNRVAAGPADHTSGDQEGHRVAPPPGGANEPSVALHSCVVLPLLRLGCAGP
jgi:hypothetical protein